jgi:hypothetical protein
LYRYVGKTASTTFTDTLVQGGYAYAYKIRAVDNCSEGPYSPCATATYSGNCTLYPTFGGITSAVNDTSTALCDSLLGWSAGTSNCPLGNTVSYNVYRGTNPYFTVSAASRIATGVSGTSYRDNAAPPNTTYYFVVRAEDGTTQNGGPANGGNEEKNTVMMSATPTASTYSNGTWSDAGGDNSLARLTLDSPWRVTNQQNHTTGGSYCYHSAPDGATYPSMQCASATTPVIPLQAGTSPVLTFWERFNLEYQWDGVVVEISQDGGAWTSLTISPDYPSTFSQTGNPPTNACGYASSTKCFTGPSGNSALSAWTSHTANLAAYAGHNVQIRWHLSSDPGAEYEGFYLDDISITYAKVPDACSCVAPPEITPQSWADKTTMTWPAETSANSYTLYRGDQAGLPNLLNGNADSCTKSSGRTANLCTVNDDPTQAAGGFYWYLVTGTNGAGQGTAGNATAGARIVNSTGACP